MRDGIQLEAEAWIWIMSGQGKVVIHVKYNTRNSTKHPFLKEVQLYFLLINSPFYGCLLSR